MESAVARALAALHTTVNYQLVVTSATQSSSGGVISASAVETSLGTFNTTAFAEGLAEAQVAAGIPSNGTDLSSIPATITASGAAPAGGAAATTTGTAAATADAVSLGVPVFLLAALGFFATVGH